jgi:hypothetical protein
METNVIIMWAILIAGLVYETTMWIYNKFKKGEEFSAEKYALTYGYVALLAIIAYATTGIVDVSAIMVTLGNNVPEVGTVLTALMTAIMYLYQQGGKLVQTKFPKTPVETENQGDASVKPNVTTPSSVTNTPIGKAKCLGIYMGSAGGNEPVNKVTKDVNQVGTMFFDLLGIVTGAIAIRLSIDGQVRTKWTSADADQSLIGVVGMNITDEWVKMATRIPKAFYLPSSMQNPGTHEIKVELGYMDSTGFVVTSTDKYTLELTGVKLTE